MKLNQTQKFKGLLIHLYWICMIISCNAQVNEGVQEIAFDQNKQITKGIEGGITVIFQDRHGNHWFGGSKQGVFKYDGKKITLYSKIDGLCGTGVLNIQEDSNGKLYFDTTEGVCVYEGTSFTFLEVSDTVTSLKPWTGSPNDLWFRMGWDNSGPFHYNKEILTHLQFPETYQAELHLIKYPHVTYNPYGVYSMYKDDIGNIWFGTSSVGLCRYDGEVVSWLYEDSLSQTPEGGAFGFRSMIRDNEGFYWINNSRYKYKISPETYMENETRYMKYKREKGIGFRNERGETEHPYFLSMTKDQKGDLWMATYDDGVYLLKDNQLSHYPVLSNGQNVLLHSIYEDRYGELWLGTQNHGVFIFKEDEFRKFEP